VPLAAVIEMLCARARVSVTIEVDPARVRPADVPYLVGNPASLSRDTGWSPTLSLEQTLGDVMEEWRTSVGGGMRGTPAGGGL
jgi:GDP-4-dehydro-6-deoxy-D-mannose reductase